jgi:hypothetical protein
MIIQSSIGVLAYNASSKIGLQQQGSGVTKSSLTDAAKIADQVTLSSEGKALASAESKMTQSRTPVQENLLRAASSDPGSAEKIAKDMANAPSGVLVDIRGQSGVGDGNGEFVLKLASTGKIVDDNYINQFNSKAPAIDAQRLAIYQTEKAKGTDPLAILSKMIDFTNSQSKDYLEATDWVSQGSSSSA